MIHAPTRQGYDTTKESTQVVDEWGSKIIDEVQPVETDIILNVVHNNTKSALEGTDLGSIIKEGGIQTVILLGFFSDICITETAVDLSDEFPGLNIIVCSDGTASSTKEQYLGAIKVRYLATLLTEL